jgi:predicted DNA-binding antitoxin AbrB/MazE fold protein
MTTRVTAVYENGVLRPTTPLPLKDGDRVEITVAAAPPVSPARLEDAAQRIRAAKSFDEWIAAAEAAAALEPDDGYDLPEALNENRRAAGVPRLLFPPEQKGTTW